MNMNKFSSNFLTDGIVIREKGQKVKRIPEQYLATKWKQVEFYGAEDKMHLSPRTVSL